MEEIPGKAENTTRYVYRGYQYHVDTTSVHLFWCSTLSSTGCRGAARVDECHVEVYKPHENHEPNETILEESRMQREMLDLATETNTPLKEIFDAVCRRNPVIAPKLSFAKMRSSMQRARAKVRPNIPESLRDLANALDTFAPTQAVYRGMVEGDDGSVALIFASNQMLEALETSDEIYVDGTFKVAPYHPPICQLYTIHIRVMDTGIAAVYVLCGARTRVLYSAVFSKISELAPGLVDSLVFIMGDYERAAMSSLRTVFPRASLHGCWFHFNQALARRWRHLGLSGARTTILAMSMALPLAPSQRFDEGLGLLNDLADAIAEDHPTILQFMRYLRTQWSPLAQVVSVYGCPSRTNNLVESFHNEAKRKLGGLHPNIWKFLEHLLDMISSQGIELDRLRNGGRVRRARTIRNMARDTLIRDAQHDLSVGRYTLREFLDRCVTRTAAISVRGNNVPEEEGAPDEAELVQPGMLAAEDPRADQPARRGGRRGVNPRNRVGGEPAGVHVEEVNAQPLAGPVQLAQANAGDQQDDHNGPEINELVDNDDEDIFHLPEDDFEVFALPEDPVPFHRVEPIMDAERENVAGRPAGTCCACLVLPATHALIPCGHRCCCAACAERIALTGRCPMCRTEVTGILRVVEI